MFQLLILLLIRCSPSAEVSCTCVIGQKPRTTNETRAAIAAKSVLFTGQVVATSFRRDSTRVLDVEKGDSIWFRSTRLVAMVTPLTVWKGHLQDTVQVETDAQTTMCGASLSMGEQYLIDAQAVDGSTVLWTDKCRWTRPLSETDELVKVLRQMNRP
jgi:Tissue inhibitor of metalloproteinase